MNMTLNDEMLMTHSEYFIAIKMHVTQENMRNTDFAAFLLECEANPQCRRKHLKELLPNPMQRVTKYPLLIQQVRPNDFPRAYLPFPYTY